VNVLANDFDVDSGDTKTVVALNTSGLKGTAVIASDGSEIVYTPHQGLRAGQTGNDTFSYTMQDAAGARSTATVSMTVVGENDAPIAVANAVTLTEDAAAATIAVLANDTDADIGDTKQVVSVDGSNLLGTATINANRSGIVYSVGNAFQHLLTGQAATETFSYTMRDAAGETSSATVTVTITGTTDGTRAVTDTVSAAEDGGPISIAVLANDFSDVNPGGALSVSYVDGRGYYSAVRLGFFDGTHQLIGFSPGFPRMLGQASIAPDGQHVLYTPLQSLNQGEVGVDQFLYGIIGSDGTGSGNAVSITVTGVNDAPSAFADSATTVADAGPIVIDVLANDTDPDTRIDPPEPPAADGPFSELIFIPTPADIPDTKTVIGVDGTGLQGSVAVAAGGGGVVYTVGGALLNLAYGATASETFSYTMRDGAGAASSASVVVTVHGTNHAPVAAADSAAISEDGSPIIIDVLANDADPDSGSGDSVRLDSVNPASLLGAAGVVGQRIEYSPGAGFQYLQAGATALDTFSYTITDSHGLSSTGTVAVMVTGANDAPVAAADQVNVSEDASPLVIAVLANDDDPDSNDTLTIESVNVAGLQGSVAISGGSDLVYTVGSGFQSLLTGQTGIDSFSYTIVDSAGARSTASVSITVVGANEPVIVVNPPPPPAGAILGTVGDNILNGTATANVMYGLDGDDELFGNAGADTLFGGNGDDNLEGGDGNDILSGGAGRDDLTGDAGADIFRYYLTADSILSGFDRIRDFSAAEGDKIDLSAIDANHVLGGNNEFVVSSSFTGVAGQLTTGLVGGTLMVQGDVNGDRVADIAIEVRFSSGATLNPADFIL
jgi:VCBS repeat-containing protein